MTQAKSIDLTIPHEWTVAKGLVPYPKAVEAMERRVEAIEAGKDKEWYWLLEHPPLYTAGTSASADELLDASGFPVYETGRGGRYTYHGPGQRVVYALCDLRQRDRDVRRHVARLEEWIILVLQQLGVDGGRREGRIGIWVNNKGREEKIAAIGVRVRHWITYHGLSFNVDPDLSHFNGIVPCGLSEFGVTSLKALGLNVTMDEVDEVFHQQAKKLMFQSPEAL